MMHALRPGLTYGAVGNRLVFMDAEANRYFLLPEKAEAAFRNLGQGNELPTGLRALFFPTTGRTVADTQTRAPVAVRAVPVGSDAFDWPETATSRYRTGRALWSRFRTEQRLRLQKLSSMLHGLDRKIDGLADDAWKRDIAMQIVRGYQEARVWRHARDRCLSESISLFEQLTAAGCRARLVFGVSLKPFAAHSWVQWGETVLNDHRDHARGYAPVFVL